MCKIRKEGKQESRKEERQDGRRAETRGSELTREGAHALPRVNVPKLQRGVGGGRHQLAIVEEAHIGHCLSVALEHLQRLPVLPHIIVVHVVVR